MDAAHNCPRCGKPLAPDAPLGLCPACLMQAGFPTGQQTSPASGVSGRKPAFTPPTPAELAPLFPQLEIFELIGQGGMGAVYRARQPSLDRIVALKILPPQTADDPGFAERFAREARALARLSHPNIVAVYDFGRAGGFHYFIMEYVDGPNLRQVERVGRLAAREALEIIPQICTALQFAHDEGIVHRDIKPENILLDKKGRVKIADFGLAKIFAPGGADREAITEAGHVMGTPHYMAPEQVEQPLAVDHRADIYSLGVVFYEMLTGELPLGRFAVPSTRAPMDVRLDEVVMRTLEKEPSARYQQASQMQTDVEAIARGAAPPPEHEPLVAPDSLLVKIGVLASNLWAQKIYFIVGFLVVFGAFILYLVNATPVFSATGSLQVIKNPSGGISASINGGPDSTQVLSDATDFNTRIRLMETRDVAERVANMMSDKEKEAFLAPYKSSNPADDLSIIGRLLSSRFVAPGRLAYIIQISVEHPDAHIAAKVADDFMQAFIDYNDSLNVDKATRSVETLEENRRQQAAKVDDLQKQIDDLIEKYGKQNLQKDSNVLPAELAQWSRTRAQDQSALQQAETRWKMVRQYRDENKNLSELSFINTDAHASSLLGDLTTLNINLSEMQQTLGPNHPDVQEALKKKALIENELNVSLNNAAERIHTDYLAAQDKVNSDNDDVSKVQDEMRKLGAAQTQYDSLVNAKDIAEAMLKEMELNITQQKFKVQDNSENYQIVDPAGGTIKQAQPKTLLLIVGGAVAGTLSGLLLVLVASVIKAMRARRKAAA